VKNAKLRPENYLRAALAYMLISMPHGTSTIFGAFQAIMALLVQGSISALATKLSRDGKIASEIFCNEACGVAASQQQSADKKWQGRSKPRGINGFTGCSRRNPKV
jgi:hypothetical protein